MMTKRFTVYDGIDVDIPADIVNEYNTYCGTFTNTTAEAFADSEDCNHTFSKKELERAIVIAAKEEIEIYKHPEETISDMKKQRII